ncbi:MAG: M56 family metallopeptidase, partial [Candidatus Nealsonbacteria bacterium]|nr:M56 family metallopeptidase [Candidatus Nealsonbacteria bacterium]
MQPLDSGLEAMVVLLVGTAMVVAAAGLLCRLIRSAVWQRTAWQVAVVAMLVLLAAEFTGFGGAIVRLADTRIESPSTGSAKVIATHSSNSRQTMPEQGPALEAVAEPVQVSPFDSLQFCDVVQTDAPFFASQFNADWEEAPAASAKLVVLEWPVAEAELEPPASPQRESTSEIEPSRIPASAEAAAPVVAADRQIPWWPVGIWAAGVAIFAGAVVRSWVLLVMFRWRHTQPADAATCRRVQRLARRLGIRRPVHVLQAGALKSPVAFGTLRPTVALPASFAEEFGSDQQEAMLMHELAHLAGWDPAWQAASDLACAALWWHPAAWWSRRRLRAANEAVADEASLLVPDGPGVLADCLLALGRRLARRQRLGWVPFEGPGFRSSLGRRVQRLLSLPKRSPRAVSRGRLALARTTLPLTIVFVIVLCTAWIRPQATQAEGETTMSVLTSSWRRSLAAMAFVAMAAPMSNDAAADDSVDATVVVVLQDGEEGDRERGEGDRERGEGDRIEGERREGGDRERREVDGERREGGDRERREVDGEPREGGDRERREVDGEPREGGDRERREVDGEPREGGDRERREVDGERREGGDRERREVDGERREGGD